MSKEEGRVLKYKNTGNCPACNSRVWHEPQTASMPPRFRCVCGYSIFEFSKLGHVDFDLLATMGR